MSSCATLISALRCFRTKKRAIWADIMAESELAGRPITSADAWIAAAARQWDLALVIADYRDYQHLDRLTLISISM